MSTKFEVTRLAPRYPVGSLAFLGALLGVAAPSVGFAQTAGIVGCPALSAADGNKYADYNDPAGASTVKLVEQFHFTPQVENLVRGQSASIPADIAFVLRAVPNHYRALSAMGRWQLANRLPADQRDIVWPASCYFDRAIAFRPEDPTLYQLYGIFLHQGKQYALAEQQYLAADRLGGGGAELYYNIGLLMLDTGRVDDAEQYAQKAYSLGYPLPGLRNRLREARRN